MRRFHREQLMVVLDLLGAQETGPYAAMAGVTEETFDRWLDGTDVPREKQLEQMIRILHAERRMCPLLEWFYTPWTPRTEPLTACRIDPGDLDGKCEIWEPDNPWSFAHWTAYPSFEPFGLADIRPIGGQVPPVSQEDFNVIQRQPEHAEQWRLLEVFARQHGWSEEACTLLEWVMRKFMP